jgi:hypothetical protein
MVPMVPKVPRVPDVGAWCVVLLVLLLPGAASAQGQTRERLPKFAIDLHAATVGLPQAEGWVPEVTADTELPGRALGLSGGGTLYPFRAGVITFGIGGSITMGKGKSESLAIVSGSGSTATTRITPVVRTGITSLAPQLSINFGHKLGWSYLSAGFGRAKVTSSADAVGTTPAIIVADSWNPAINFGGGAKWFMKPRLGASFDVRFVKLSSRSPTETLPSAKRTQMWTISAGISIQ